MPLPNAPQTARPPGKLVHKTYPITTQAAAPSVRPVPHNLFRVSLIIQNTGANPGQVRLGDPGQGPGLDLTFAAGFLLKWDQADTCPQEAVNLSSVLATSWSVVEGTRHNAPNAPSSGHPHG